MTSIGVDTAQILKETLANSVAAPALESTVSIHDQFHKILTFFEALFDGLTMAVAVFGGYTAYRLLHLGRHILYPNRMLWFAAFATAGLYVILLDRDGAYRTGNSLLRIKETERTLRVSAQTFLLVIPITFFSTFHPSRWVFLIALLCAPILQVVEKQLMFQVLRAWRSRGFGEQRVLIYGAGSTGRRVFSALLRSPKLGLKPIAVLDDDPSLAGDEIFEYSYRRDRSVRVATEPITKETLENYGCDLLILAIPSLNSERIAQIVGVAHSAKARLAFVPGQAFESEYWTEHADVDGTLLRVVGRPRANWYYETAKRLFDLLAALSLIVVLAPVWLLIALLVRLDSPGPILFRQQRVGRKGTLFNLFKFRSMYVDAPRYAFSPKDSVDPRITRIGRILRRSSLDELPQLLNVVKGEMSLVGPRPEMPFIVRDYKAQHRQRLAVTPGITGLWQISADRAYLIHENIQYDLYYIRNRSFFMDCAILLHTLVFAMHGV
jgi:exopolysaccharide biosynthesis polyprenyl glycosylphosphotransferase